MTKNIKDESLFVYCPTCREEGCRIVEAEGNDLESEEVLYFTCGNRKCEDYGRDLEPSKEWWARYCREEEVARAEAEEAELARLIKKDVKVACMQWTGSVLVFDGGPLNFDLLISVDEAGNECWDHPAIHPDHS